MVLWPLGLWGFYWSLWGRSSEAEQRSLRVYSYSSFMSPWGPGPELARKFEERTGRVVQWIDAGDSQALVERLRFRSPHEVVDLVLGLDQLALRGARRSVRWQTPKIDEVVWSGALPEGAAVADFTPLQWAPLSFLHRGGYKDVRTLEDLTAPEFAKDLLLLDPRTSTPGFQFLNWVVGVFGEEGAIRYLSRLKASVHSVQSSWSLAYQLFRKGEAGAIFTYVTSAIYHWEEGDTFYQPVDFSEGLPVQVEYMGVPENCGECDTAHEFMGFLLEPESQRLIMEKNYMLPVIAGVEPLIPNSFSLAPSSFREELDVRQLLSLWKRAGM